MELDNSVYIAGPMTGHKDFNFPAFHEMAASLRARGFTVINPAEIAESEPVPPGTKPYDYYLRRAIVGLLKCRIIYMLPGWSTSKGACIEQRIAVALGMPVIGAEA